MSKQKHRDSLNFILVPHFFLAPFSLSLFLFLIPLIILKRKLQTIRKKSNNNEKPNKIQNSKCEKLCDAQEHMHIQTHAHDAQTHERKKKNCVGGKRERGNV